MTLSTYYVVLYVVRNVYSDWLSMSEVAPRPKLEKAPKLTKKHTKEHRKLRLL